MAGPTPYDCHEAFARLADFLDRELDPAESAQVQAHLDVCEHCAAAFGFERRLLDALKAKLRGEPVPPRLLERVRRLLAGTPPDRH